MGLKIKQARLISFNATVRHAVALEVFNRAEKSKLEGQGTLNSATASVANQELKAKQSGNESQELKSTVDRLGKKVTKICFREQIQVQTTKTSEYKSRD